MFNQEVVHENAQIKGFLSIAISYLLNAPAWG